MHARSLLAMVLVLASVLATSCKSDVGNKQTNPGDANGSGVDAPPGATIPLNQWSAALVTAACGKLTECCTAEEISDYGIVSPDTCQTYFTDVYEGIFLQYILKSVTDARILYDAEKAAACIDTLQTMTCSDFSSDIGSLFSFGFCESPLLPNIADFDPCIANFDCPSGWCVEEKCAPTPEIGTTCEFGLCGNTSDLRCSNSTCQAKVGLAQACSNGSDCESGFCKDSVCVALCDGQ